MGFCSLEKMMHGGSKDKAELGIYIGNEEQPIKLSVILLANISLQIFMGLNVRPLAS